MDGVDILLFINSLNILPEAYQFCSSLREHPLFSAEVAMSHLSCILSFDLISEQQMLFFGGR